MGGWDSRDHDGFLRAWVQTFGGVGESKIIEVSDSQRASLLTRLLQAVPVKTEEEFNEHIDWFVQYNTLHDRKKKYLEQWKDSRTTDRNKKVDTLFAEVVEEETDKKPAHNGTDKDRAALKSRIEAWRHQKEEDKKQEVRLQKERAHKEAESRQAEMRRRQEMNKLELERWKKEEAATKKKVNNTQNTVRGPSTKKTNSQLLERQAQDRYLTQMRVAQKEAAEEKHRSREIRMRALEENLREELDISVERDPDRLLSGTRAFDDKRMTGRELLEAEERRAGYSAHESRIPMSGRDLSNTRRAVPSWLGHK
jgi:hypothetical protein